MRRTTPRASPRLAPLADATGFRVAEGEPDPRGWGVVAGDAREIGSIVELIVDTESLKVSYLECRLADQRAVFVPIGFARLDPAAELVIVDVLGSAELLALADTSRLPTTAEEEAALLAAFRDRSGTPDG
jgi:hypothetical protein